MLIRALIAGLVFVAAVCEHARGQCVPEWTNAFSVPLQAPSGFGVHAMCVFDDGTGPALYVGGNFVSDGTQALNGIAKWTGAGWSPLGSGLQGLNNVADMIVFDPDGAGPTPARLAVGGKFASAGGVPNTRGLALWTGQQWVSCGTDEQGVYDLHDLETFDLDGAGPNPVRLIIAGHTSGAYSGFPDRYTATFSSNGSSVARLGTLATGALCTTPFIEAYALAVIDPDGSGPLSPDLIVGGYWYDIEIANCEPTNPRALARWSGTNWADLTQRLPSGSTSVNSLAIHDFDGSGPQSPSLIVNGHRLINGAPNYQNSVALAPPAGAAQFSPPRVLRSAQLADDASPSLYGAYVTGSSWWLHRFREGAWSPQLAGPFNSPPDSMLLIEQALLVGGGFTPLAGQPANRIGRWGCPLLAPCPGDTNGDNVVNFIDLNAVLSFFGQSGPMLPGDLNDDGVVNFLDLNEVLSFFGTSC